MLNQQKMTEQVSRYQMGFVLDSKEVFIIKDSNDEWVKVSYKRAVEWINAGIDDIDCRSKEQMLKLVSSSMIQ